ncbi:MAG: sulfite exporter TauE/SafE family protein [Patescibacteria group bacterium]|nr:sulfite exporter TauE/SafE family protein [Patescibacteria group bacterium]
MSNLWVVFLTGLTVGGVSCMAVQGGLLASVIAAREEEDLKDGKKKKHSVWPVAVFLICKLAIYTLLGLALGAFGGVLQISAGVRTTIQLFAGLYMLAVAMNLLNVHPIFRYVTIQPPRFLTKLVRNRAKSKDLFAPALLGLSTIFIPCGTTLAMEALAISSGQPLSGAAILGAFVLGTSPLFFLLGYITTVLGDAFRSKFLKLAAILVIYLGISSINGALILSGSPLTIQSVIDTIPIQINLDKSVASSGSDGVLGTQMVDGKQNVDIQVLPNGYNPDYIKVKAGIPVKLNLAATGGLGCTSTFVIPQLKISKNLVQGSTTSVEFTPSAPGKITWSCSMGMYSGVMEVTP